MSSNIEGSEDREREDELDLGQEDEGPFPPSRNGVLESPGPRERAENGTTVYTEEDLSPVTTHDYTEKTALPADSQTGNLPSTPRLGHLGAPGSVDETASTPDDTPSLHGSILSSQSGSALALRASPRPSPSPSHRPFDLRFQSRLSLSPTGFRPSSPFLAHIHSRKSSFTSRISLITGDSDAEPLQGPWDVVRWTKLRKITGQAFSEVGKRNFGHPTCMAVSTSIVVGTSKGIILVFDYQQSLKTIIGPGTKAVECGAITSLALSADHTTVAGGHASGDIYTWEISRSARPFLHIPPIPASQIDSRSSDGHIAATAVIHLGFLGTRRTALVSADQRGMAFSHLATRGMGAVGRTVKTTRILGRYPQTIVDGHRLRRPSSVLAFSPLPLGNVEQSTDSLGLVAMLTPYLLVIVSTTPVAQTQYKCPRPKEVAAHGAMTGALAWFPAIKLKGKESETSKTKLAYCWSNVLTVLDVSEVETDEPPSRDKPPALEFIPRRRWKAEEAIVAVQWLSRSVLAVLTITQQLLILEDYSMRVTDAVDLLNRHIYHVDLFSSQLHSLVEQFDEEDTSMHGVVADAFYMSFRSYKGRLFLMGFNEASVGGLSNWADRLIALMEAGDFIGAMKLATSYYRGDAEKLTVGLPEEDALRQPIVREKLLEMVTASLKYAFGRNAEANNERLESRQLEELAEVAISACVSMAEEEFLWDEVFNWYEENDSQGVFLDALESYIVDGTVRSLPPTAVKALINHFATSHSASRLEEIICLLDTTTMDIDQVTTLCKHYNLYDAFIYVWNRCLGDYVGPLEELLKLVPSTTGLVNGDSVDGFTRRANATKMFPYLSFVLTGRIYPTGEEMEEAEATQAKTSLYDYLFSGNLSGTEPGSFSSLQTILRFDASSFMSMLNEAFEDSFLNDQESEGVSLHGLSVNRQYLISILLQVMAHTSFAPSDTIYLDMFIARNLPKYPQYILLSGTTLHQVLERLCRYPDEEMADDCELSAEYLLSSYRPPDVQSLIPLFKEARFYRILKSTYRSERQFSELILTYLVDPNEQDAVFTCLQDCLRPGSALGKKQRRDVIDVIKSHAGQLVSIDVSKAALTMDDVAPETHETFLKALEEDSYKQYQYLLIVVEPQQVHAEGKPSKSVANWMIERYVQLLCKYNPSHVADFVDDLRTGDVRLEELLPPMEESGVVDAAVILLARQGQVRGAMDRLTAHLSTLESGLVGILQSVQQSPDSASTAEAILDLLESLDKYSRIGTWLCQNQSQSVKKSRPERNGTGSRNAVEQPLSFDEILWLDLIEAVVRIASSVFALMRGEQAEPDKLTQLATIPSPMDGNAARLISSVRTLVQQVFTALLSSTVKVGGASATTERSDVAFLRILRAFLSRAASWSPSLLELRAVLASVFSAYTYEKSLLALANGMLDRDLFVHVEEVTRLRQRGWRPRGQACEICRQRIWGPGVGSEFWEAWEKREEEEARTRVAKHLEGRFDPAAARGKGKAAAVDAAVDPRFRVDHDPHHLHDNEAGTAAGTGQATGDGVEKAVGPAVVFSCRHLYHRQCLLDTTKNKRDSAHFPLDGTLELSCPTCI
ncbi:CORVET complex membrane-binding subunit VPS8 [Aspergillus clavatus NRRL 1]|uniref:Golgi complex component (Vps8), putative n=1 Tax=Aspergillus clavatus (strain ATCC 1007 / CBS 513.65 / DSM 816 / NCTC 3887 / NRRL 1 / QM 1276 / 107) TaxID=344612 RepID=A1CRD8_ASPCL|nr:Golgi complex component (Vps8), putative [Aspergillus clavatus NRRL 1]EAW08209.1 Golgi complex component (Vps8), putative [Aspergillus clavatus NRRL 1]